jgi:protein-L-isoaspartate(D-aspartate) O-methyltransferase
MLRLDRGRAGVAARSLGWVAFYPCAGARSAADEAAIGAALGSDLFGQQGIRSLRRDDHARDDSCWLHGEGWCLSKHELH